MTPKPPTDWEAIEREYRAGQLSVREIARTYSVSHVAIAKRAKAHGWTKDLAERVRREVTNRLVTSQVTKTDASDREIVEVAANRAVEVVKSHRIDIANARRLVSGLFAEAAEIAANRDAIVAVIEGEVGDDITPTRRASMLRAVSLPARAATAKDLSAALKGLLPLERQAHSIESAMPDEPATSGEVRAIIARLDQHQRDQLRSIATALVNEPERAH